MRVVLHPSGVIEIDGVRCYRIWEDGRDYRWARDMDYWPDDGVGHDDAHGKRHSKAEAVLACVEHYQTRRVLDEARELREEKDIE